MKARSLKLLFKKREREFPDFTKRTNQLLGNLTESTQGHPLQIDQLEVIIEHLRYALVVGFEAGLEAR